MTENKIILFGGTFDPIHLGHTTVASEAFEYIGADKLIFIPAKRSPLKNFKPYAGDDDRIKMIKSAIKGIEHFEISDYELNKSQPSYTIETIRYFQAEFENRNIIYWLIGADNINELPYWYKIEELIDSCNPAVMYRAGYEKPDFSGIADILGQKRVDKLNQNIVPTSLIDISSTEIRKKLAAGEDVGDLLHPAVAEYIKRHKLYQ